MASRKALKKQIDQCVGQLLLMTAVAAEQVSNENKEKVYQLAQDIARLHDDLIRRVNHTEPGRARAYYRALQHHFVDTTKQIMGQLLDLLPE